MAPLNALWKSILLASALLLLVPLRVPSAAPEAASPDKKMDPLESLLPDGFEMTIRVNARQILDAPELQSLRERFLIQHLNRIAGPISAATQVDIRRDIDTIVLAGFFDQSRKADGIVLVKGFFDKNALIALVRTTPQYTEKQSGDFTIHGFFSQQDQDLRFALFPGNGTIAIGRQDQIERMAEALSGKSAKMQDSPAYAALLKTVPDDAVFAVVGAVPPAQNNDQFQKALMKDLGNFCLKGKLDKQLSVDLSLHLPTPETAALKRQALEGILAVVQMMEDRPLLGNLAKAVKVSCKESDVIARAEFPYDTLGNMLALHPKFKQAEAAPVK